MKFTDGYWRPRTGVNPIFAHEAYEMLAGTTESNAAELKILAPSGDINHRGDTLNRPTLTVTLTAPRPEVICVTVSHYQGGADAIGMEIQSDALHAANAPVTISNAGGSITSGELTAQVRPGAPWQLSFHTDGTELTSSGAKSIAHMTVAPGVSLDNPLTEELRRSRPGKTVDEDATYMNQQLALGVGELIYGLGERFGPLVKNGQTVDIWNADGGTASEQAYKNVPFYLSNRGYGVLVDHTGLVSFEVGSENVKRVQFTVPGETLRYYIIAGKDQKDVLRNYTALTGRAPQLPAWSYGTWLSTSFTTDYDEATVSSFVDGMQERDIPLSVFHFDCFWMREFTWCDFEWDSRVFPDPTGMLARLHDKDLKICVWINPYLGQHSKLFAHAKSAGYLVRRRDGSVWQWDQWQAGMALIDFTNPAATKWYQDQLRQLLDQGVDAFKTDFGERVPVDVVWHNGADPEHMHNWYTHLYNRAVFEVLQEKRPQEAVVFARSATAGGQQFPVHWGGDSESTYESLAETLRGGLSLSQSGFAHWSHDIGGFEGTPDSGVFKRWVAFGYLSSHTRFHGSSSYRVPWLFDAEAVDITRKFAHLKMSLMPYLYQAGMTATSAGTPVLRAMALEFPDDPATAYLDRQYMLGESLLVAPIFNSNGAAEFYLPAGKWANFWSGEYVDGGVWRQEVHDFSTLPLYIRRGTVLPVGARTDRPDYDYFDGITLEVFPVGAEGRREVTVTNPNGDTRLYVVSWSAGQVTAASSAPEPWHLRVNRGIAVTAQAGIATLAT